MKKEFHTLDVLGAATGVLMNPEGIGGIYEVLSFASGESVFTHQLPRVSREFEEVLKRTRPDLAEAFIEAGAITPENCEEIGDRWVKRYGERIEISRMSAEEHAFIDPLSELVEKVHPDNIIVIDGPDGA